MTMNWNAVVSEEDTVFVLGDFVMRPTVEKLRVASRLNGKKILIPGNHDNCWRGHEAHELWRQRYLDAGFTAIVDKVDMYFDDFDLKLSLSHFPFDDDKPGWERFDNWRSVDDGQWLLHGHIHSRRRVSGRQIHVGCDAWNWAPVSLDRILELIVE